MPCSPVAPVAPVFPRGIVKLIVWLGDVPAIVTEADDPAFPVVTVPTDKTFDGPAAPVAPLAPAGPGLASMYVEISAAK